MKTEANPQMGRHGGQPLPSSVIRHPSSDLRLVAWELTRKCNLNCVHCRAGADRGPYPGELDTEKCLEILAQIQKVGNPIVILTGGEPLLREDIFDLAREGTHMGLRMVMATNGTLLTPEIIARMKTSGIQRLSISIDGATAKQHDAFRQVPGAYERAMEGIALLNQNDFEFQINTTVSRHNVNELENLKATCAPHYYRILRQEARKRGEKVSFETYGLDGVTRGCLGGTSFCFISNTGIVQPCGYLELDCGDLKTSSFQSVWADSKIFNSLRDFSKYKGKCGRCGYIRFCGGCRARAYEATGDYLAEEPLCAYEPAKIK